ncbi:hypothetical protein GCM10022226_47310 [Sphaerisporangium flaviroseum]|uniref:Uncharacterized protein n=1 Tax=Sphaerisporangium flaviroseum TaxID=509199 RepID=A0ABP7ILM8_9ACTN
MPQRVSQPYLSPVVRDSTNALEHTMTTSSGRRGRHARPDPYADSWPTAPERGRLEQGGPLPLSAPIPAQQVATFDETMAETGRGAVRRAASLPGEVADLRGHLAAAARLSPDDIATAQIPAVDGQAPARLPPDVVLAIHRVRRAALRLMQEIDTRMDDAATR